MTANLRGDPPSLLPGRSAKRWSIVTGRSLLMAPVVSVLFVLGFFILAGPLSAFAVVCGLLLSLWITITAIRAALEIGRAERLEREAGYTTLFGKHYDLWQLDDRTGEVLRRPGERSVPRRLGRQI
jgi:hypothetical protein